MHSDAMLVVAFALALAGGVVAAVEKAWAVVLVAAGVCLVCVELSSLFK